MNESDAPGGRRSAEWTHLRGVDGFLQPFSLKAQGLCEKNFDRPSIGICNDRSDFNRSRMHFAGMINGVKESVLRSGGLPRVLTR